MTATFVNPKICACGKPMTWHHGIAVCGDCDVPLEWRQK